MLAKIKGTIIEIFPDFVIIDNSGIGYRVETVEKDFIIGQEVDLFIHTHIRETEFRLFGFKKRDQFLLFNDLIDISGVGPKIALTLLNSLSFDSILNSIENKDISTLKVKGLGQKTAQRIIIDMTTKLDKYKWLHTDAQHAFTDGFVTESTEALANLGFARTEIKSILKEYGGTEGTKEDLGELVKFALKQINRSKDAR